MTTLVTGGSGLVGSHVIEVLRASGEPVRALVRPAARDIVAALGADPVIGDITDEAAWQHAAQGVTAIVHAAALVLQRASWDEYRRVNVGGTRQAVLAAQRTGARLVHISSVAVYGGSAAYRATPERRDEGYAFRPLADLDRYARSKREAENVVREAGAAGLAAVAIRPNVIYGERDRLFTPQLLPFARLGWAPAIGPGTNRLACVYAGNVAAAVVAALERPRPGFRAYNVTGDRPPALTAREFVTAFGRALGRRMRYVRVPLLAFQAAMAVRRGPRLARAAVSFLTGENPWVFDRICRELEWEPPYATVAAIERTVERKTKAPEHARAPRN